MSKTTDLVEVKHLVLGDLDVIDNCKVTSIPNNVKWHVKNSNAIIYKLSDTSLLMINDEIDRRKALEFESYYYDSDGELE